MQKQTHGQATPEPNGEYFRKIDYRGYVLAVWTYQQSALTPPRPRWDVLNRDGMRLRMFSNRVHAESYVDHLL